MTEIVFQSTGPVDHTHRVDLVSWETVLWAYQWCQENASAGSWYYHTPARGDTFSFTFVDAETALLFRLVWA
jgi:hypothetical protein